MSLGKKIIAALSEFTKALESGEPLEHSFRVTTVERVNQFENIITTKGPTKEQTITDEEFATVLTKFRRSSEIMRMRKECRLDLESLPSDDPKHAIAKRHLAIIDAELVRRGLRPK